METGAIFYVALAIIAISGAVFAGNRWVEARRKLQTRQRFLPYLAPRVIDKAMNASGVVELKPERREMSVLFSDIHGFTGLSEKMLPAEAVTFLNRYFDRMSSLIFKDRGTLDKFSGDGVMCFWGIHSK